jgi:bifunctional isochorismate lyase/aryl carrier protein
MSDSAPATPPADFTIEQMRADIADVLQETVEAIVPGENLVDVGLDSIRIMMLAERWSAPGARIEFEDLAAYPELHHWWEVVARRRAAGSAG